MIIMYTNFCCLFHKTKRQLELLGEWQKSEEKPNLVPGVLDMLYVVILPSRKTLDCCSVRLVFY